MRPIVLLTLAYLHGTVAFQGPPDVIERMAEAYRELDALEADLVQTNSYPQLGLTDPPETGHLQIEKTGKGMNVRLELTEPAPRILAIKDGDYVLFQPRINQAIVGRAGQNSSSRTGSFLKYLVGDVSGVEEEFHVEVLGTERVAEWETTRLRLIPKNPAASLYRSIELWVDEKLSLPIQEKLIEPNGDETLIRLSDIRVNPSTEHFEFEIELPRDVERIQG